MTYTHICVGGPQRVISVNGTIHHFEMHPRFGPINTNANGDVIKPLGARHAFWYAVTQWSQQGERIEGGLCAWDHPAAPLVERRRINTGKRTQVVNCCVGYAPVERGS